MNVQTVRYYERMQLLPDAHRWPASGYRDFDDEALLRLRFIRAAKDLGFTLNEIKELRAVTAGFLSHRVEFWRTKKSGSPFSVEQAVEVF